LALATEVSECDPHAAAVNCKVRRLPPSSGTGSFGPARDGSPILPEGPPLKGVTRWSAGGAVGGYHPGPREGPMTASAEVLPRPSPTGPAGSRNSARASRRCRHELTLIFYSKTQPARALPGLREQRLWAHLSASSTFRLTLARPNHPYLGARGAAEGPEPARETAAARRYSAFLRRAHG